MNSYRMAALAAVTLAFGMVAFASEPAAKIKRVPDAGPKEELHVIGLYEGATKTGNEIHGGRARVKVDRPGKTITLALVAYESVTWEVMPTPDTQVTKVILGGYHRHAIKGLPEAVQVVKANYEENERGTRLPYAHEVESPNYRQLARQLHEMTGMKIASFQGKYRYTHDSPFVVDRRIGEDRLQADYPKPTPLEQLPKLKFQGVHLTSGDLFRWLGSFGDFTLGGADKNSLKPLPRDVLQIAYDPAGKKHYGRGMHEVYEVDLANGQAKKMNMGINVPRLSWPCGI